MPEGFVPTSYIEASKSTNPNLILCGLWIFFQVAEMFETPQIMWTRRVISWLKLWSFKRCETSCELDFCDWLSPLFWQLWGRSHFIVKNRWKVQKHCFHREIHKTSTYMTLRINTGSEDAQAVCVAAETVARIVLHNWWWLPQESLTCAPPLMHLFTCVACVWPLWTF